MSLPDAGTKLRLVLDYLPCEACLAQPVADQDLLCTICARLDRQVAIRVATRTTVLVERPAPAPAPIVIPPAPETAPAPENAAPAPVPAPVARETHVRFVLEEPIERAGVTEVVVERLETPPSPVPMLLPREEPVVSFVAPEPDEPSFDVDDVVTFVAARDEFFDYKKGAPAPPPRREPARVEEAAPPEDDFVFRPPVEEAAPPAKEEPILSDEVVPSEEVRVEPTQEVEERWAPPAEEAWKPAPDFLQDEEETPQAAPPVQETPAEAAPVEDDVLEMEVIPEEEDVVEMEVMDDEPAPARASSGDLYRLRGFDASSEGPLARSGITQVVHLSGHDAGELSSRTGLPFARLASWIQVADLVQDVGVPVDAANALVAAGIAGPRGLAEADPEEVADRVAAFGGLQVNASDVRRWKRRA